MTDPLPSPGSAADNPVDQSGTGSTTGAPRWVKLLGAAIVVLVLVFIVLLLIGGHGPGRHMSDGPAAQPALAGVAGADPRRQ